MNLKSRISRLEEKSGDKLSWNRVVNVVTHEDCPEEKLDAFLRENGFDSDDPRLLVINHWIVNHGGEVEMFEPRFADERAPNA